MENLAKSHKRFSTKPTITQSMCDTVLFVTTQNKTYLKNVLYEYMLSNFKYILVLIYLLNSILCANSIYNRSCKYTLVKCYLM